MKKMIVLISLFLAISCQKKSTEILGTWKVISKYYKATYKIVRERDSVKAQVLYYNDDTTVYKFNDNNEKWYQFTNLKSKNDTYIDVVSGATKNAIKETLTIIKKHKDTLEVTSYIMKKPLKEIWVRVK